MMGGLFIVLISCFLLALLIYLMYKPWPLVWVLRRLYHKPQYEVDETIFEIVENDSRRLRLRSRSTASRKVLLVVLVGGSFVLESPFTHIGCVNELSQRAAPKARVDVLFIRYPLRFEHTIHESLSMISEELSRAGTHDYDKTVLLSFSAGTYLGLAYICKESSARLAKQFDIARVGVTFDAMVTICGLFSGSFDNQILAWLFDTYVLGGIPRERRAVYEQGSRLDLAPMPRLIISNSNDLLAMQSSQYCAFSKGARLEMFDSEILPHSFPQLTNLKESQECYDKIVKFIIGLFA